MQYFALDPPKKLPGFDCARCYSKEPVIAGAAADSDATTAGPISFDRIGILTDGRGGPRHALFCATCFEQVQRGEPERHDPLSQPPAVSAVGAEKQQQQHRQTKTMDQNTSATVRPARKPAAPGAAPATRIAVFAKEKDTKNTVKFAEVPQEGQAPICGTLYLQKWVVGNASNVQVEISLS